MKTQTVFFSLCLILFFAGSPFDARYDLGDTVADFKLKNVDDRTVGLSDYKNRKGVIVIFDSNTCPYSKAYNGRIIALNKKYEPLGFSVITINANDGGSSEGDSFEEMVAIAKRRQYDFPYLLDESQNVAKSFGATNTPHAFVLKNERTTFKIAYIGAIDDNARDASAVRKRYVEDAVDALLANKEVPTPKTRAIGCGIRWKD